MPRKIETGIPALFKYQELKYYPFNVQPASSLLLSSDPFSYLKAFLELKMKGKNGDNKARLRRAKYFVDQSESFFQASSHTMLPTKGTLVYYSLLNLVKAFLSVRGHNLEYKNEIHGLSLSQTNENNLSVVGSVKNCVNVFQEFCKELGTPLVGKCELEIKDVLSDIPEIHEIVFSLNQLNSSKRKLLPIEIEFLVNNDKTHLFTELSYQKKNEYKVPIDRFYLGKRKEYFKLISENNDGWVTYRSSKRKSFNKANIGTKYLNICKEYSKLSISTILTRNGYKYYVNLKSSDFHQLACSFMLIFYVGSIARYKPTLTQQLMNSEMRPILSEAIDTCPTQFLYQIASLMTESIVAVPQAKI